MPFLQYFVFFWLITTQYAILTKMCPDLLTVQSIPGQQLRLIAVSEQIAPSYNETFAKYFPTNPECFYDDEESFVILWNFDEEIADVPNVHSKFIEMIPSVSSVPVLPRIMGPFGSLQWSCMRSQQGRLEWWIQVNRCITTWT